ncbi:MAG: NAD(P)-dependent oxidoreductase [bacterium]
MKRRVLVCGATGFIGRNIAEDLAKDDSYEVTGTCLKRQPYEHPGLRMVQADLRDPAASRLLEGMDIVIQAAATTSGAGEVATQPYIHVTDNAVMNSVLFRAAHERGVGHLVFFSCTVMYPSSETPLKETDFNASREMYKSYFGAGWTKVYLEKMCEFYSRLGRTSFTVLRHSNIYGPYDKYDLERSHVFGATIAKVMTASDGRIKVWGTGDEQRDLLHVSDLTAAVRLAIQAEPAHFRLYNVGSGVAVSVRELAQRIIRHSGRKLSIEHDLSLPSFKTAFCLDCANIRAELGWRPQVELDDGIMQTLEWYRRNISPDSAVAPHPTLPLEGGG